jgi:mono/diheme cytochrome c family protein
VRRLFLPRTERTLSVLNLSGMPLLPKISRVLVPALPAFLTLLFFLPPFAVSAQKDDALYATGEKVFKGNCASCHKPDKDMTGPALKGARTRWEGKGDIYAWVKNSQAVVKAGNPYAVALFAQWNKSVMTPNALSDADIDAVLHYVDNYTAPAAAVQQAAEVASDGGDRSLWSWMWVLGLLFLVVALSLSGVKKQLRQAVNDAHGAGPAPDRGFWGNIGHWIGQNKAWASVIGLFVFAYLVVAAWNWAFRNVGVYGGDKVAHYKPEQPIKFNHTLHAGKAEAGNLAINCQYCHSTAEKSKHASIPSANVCMNCHKAVNEGRSEAGTAEIKKIYEHAGWDGKEYSTPGNPIAWVKVHNLPDHVAFSHATHVSVGKVDCKECHGPIDEKMDVAEQWSPLTMGWCIDCHRQREVQMAGNGYYDEIMRRLTTTDLGHGQLRKYLKDDKITVEELGGLECAKCHY